MQKKEAGGTKTEYMQGKCIIIIGEERRVKYTDIFYFLCLTLAASFRDEGENMSSLSWLSLIWNVHYNGVRMNYSTVH